MNSEARVLSRHAASGMVCARRASRTLTVLDVVMRRNSRPCSAVNSITLAIPIIGSLYCLALREHGVCFVSCETLH